MKIRLYKGTSDSFGLGISFCNWDKSLTISFMKWYFGAEIHKVQNPQEASYLKGIVMSIPIIIYFKKYYHSFVMYISYMISTSINIHRNIPLNMYQIWHNICQKFVLKPGQIVHILINNRIIIHYINLFPRYSGRYYSRIVKEVYI
jgi:hypothetical protein